MASDYYEAILESISDGVFTVDPDWRVVSFNRAAEDITGIDREEALGRRCWEVFRSNMCESSCALRETLRTGTPVIGRTGYIIDAAGSRIPISLSTAVLRDSQGKVIGGAETFRDLSELQALRRELDGRVRLGDLISRSPRMQEIFDSLEAVAASPSTVLVLGETGTGKDLVARTIHGLSARKDGPFVAVNCGALPENLLESELFGYKAGAFTGAQKDKPGRFALAKGGVLFLDEIGEISPAMQVRLLRVLQERSYEPLGAVSSEQADVRVIAATHRDLAEQVKQGSFREDLFYRINVARIELPPLRARMEDIPLLCDLFVEHFNGLQNKHVEGLSSETLALLLLHDWPGNIRELRNVIERGFILCGSGLLEPRHLPEELRRAYGAGAEMAEVSRTAATGSVLRDTRHNAEALRILDALERVDYNRLEAARALGIHKSTLFRKIRQFGLELPKQDGRSSR